MKSQLGLLTIAIHILPNVSQSKGNQTMKFRQLIEYHKVNFFFKNYPKNEAGALVPDLFYFEKKFKMRPKQVVHSLASIYFDSPQITLQ